MRKKYTQDELLRLDAVEVYKLLLKGYIKKFPNGFWLNPESLSNSKKITKFLIEELLCLKEEEIPKKLSAKMFKDNKLAGMLQHCFNFSPYQAIVNAYPERDYKPWAFNMTPMSYWTKETGILATKWLVDEHLKLTEEELKSQLSKKLFEQNGLGGMINMCFNSSPYQAISESYPERNYKPWDFSITPMGYWTKETGIQATKWLIDEYLQLNENELKDKLSKALFYDNGLSGMLEICFNKSPFLAISSTYPERNYKPWEFKHVPRNYWTKEIGVQAVKWLIEEHLKLTEEQIKEQLSKKIFKDNRLCGMLSHCFNDSPFNAINSTYPNRFKKEDFKNYYV